MGKLRVYCLKTLKKLSIYPLGNTPSAPSATSWEISRNISNVLCQNTIGTLFGIFLNVPNNFPIGKPQFHHLGHHKSILSFPWWGNCKEISLENFECICNVPKFSQRIARVVHLEEKGEDIPNVPLWYTLVTLFWFVLSFTNLEHHNPIGWEIARNISNVPCWNITGTLFGNPLNVPTNCLTGKLQSHHLGHCKSILSFPWWENCKETGWKYSECTCNILGGFWLVLCPFPCNVFVMYQVETPSPTPSVICLCE